MDTKLSILFYGKRAKITADELLPIYMRITIECQRFEISTKRYIETNKWLSVSEKAKGN